MQDIEKVLEFDQIKQKMMKLAYTDKAKDEICSLKPYMSELELAKQLRETSEARFILEKAGNPPLTAIKDIDELIEIACKGGCLTAEQLERIAVQLTAVKRLKDYLSRCKQYNLGLPYYDENLDSIEDLREELHLKIRNGRVDDFASKLLKSLRSGIEQTEFKIRTKADSIMRANKDCMSDSFCTLRNGRICLPVKKDSKAKIRGLIVDKSSTGSTLFIEPHSVSKYYEELQNLKLDEENEVRRILYVLSGMLADIQKVMKMNNRTIEKLDFIFVKGKLSMEYDGIEPVFNTERRIQLINARHPLMDKKVNIPLNFEIGQKVKGIIITGPNTGGKTVAIKTVAINCMMAQCGLHVPCDKAYICMNNAFLCDIGDGQNISENLSTFSAHVTNVLDILRKASKDSLVVLDELGSGTDPTEGMGIAISILDELKKSGALYLVTTHYPEVKNYADMQDGIINARMTFDKESLKPLYQLIIGEAGESCAFYIAKRLGMPQSMLRRASLASYGKEQIDGVLIFDKQDELQHENNSRIQKKKVVQNKQKDAEKFHLGDSVVVYPDKKIGIVCETANEKGVLRVQLPDKKIWINHKRIKLKVAASELYPEDYDFSIIFDSVENRKARHQMERKYVAGEIIKYD